MFAQPATVLTEKENWLREVLFAGWAGGDHREAWNDLLSSIDSLAVEAATAMRIQLAHGPELPEDRLVEHVAATLDEIIHHLESGHSLGLMTKLRHRNWHELIELCRVEGHVPQTIDEFRALRAVARLQESRTRFGGRWRRTVESLGGPQVGALGNSPERAAQGYAAEIRNRLEWRTAVWEALINELRAAAFRWDAWLATHPPVSGDHGELARVQRAASEGLADIVEAQAALIRQTELSTALQSQRTYLAGFPESEAASVLLGAQDAWNTEEYEAACIRYPLGIAREIRTCSSRVGACSSSARETTRCCRAAGRCSRSVEVAPMVARARAACISFDDGLARAT